MNVVWYTAPGVTAPPKGYWCYGFLEEVFAGFDEHSIDTLPFGEAVTIIVPAEYHVDHVEQINHDLAEILWVRLILASDERGIFPIEQLRSVDELWVMTPHFEKHVYPEGTRFLSCYYPPDARALISAATQTVPRKYAGSFSGQITHERRVQLAESEIADGRPDFYFNPTKGFTQGLGREDYYQLMVDTCAVPCPSGPVTLDSFRAFEALEAGAVPILDLKCPVDQDGIQYWNAVLGEWFPLPRLRSWHGVSGAIYFAQRHAEYRNNVFAWWQLHKRKLKQDLTGVGSPGDITVLVPTSPIQSHPSMKILLETLSSIRFHLPDADIIIMCDGVRSEQEDLKDAYDEYVRELLWLCNFDELWKGIYPLVSVDHQHQANMTRRALDHVTTPLVLFVEHDTPLVLDRIIDWPACSNLVQTKDCDMLRFHFEGRIHPEHERLFIDPEQIMLHGVPVRRTLQWSQRPHLATAKYYRQILHQYFPPTGRTMIEDKMHSCAQSYPEFHKLAVYHQVDEDGSIVRSYHTDGRGSASKFAMVYE